MSLNVHGKMSLFQQIFESFSLNVQCHDIPNQRLRFIHSDKINSTDAINSLNIPSTTSCSHRSEDYDYYYDTVHNGAARGGNFPDFHLALPSSGSLPNEVRWLRNYHIE